MKHGSLSGPVEAFAGLPRQQPAILAEGASDELLATHAQLFPADSVSIAALRDLESWFRTDRATREHRDWDDTLATTFGTVDPQDLPAIVTRTHTPLIFVHELTASDVITHSAHPTGPQPGVSGQKHRSPHSPNQDEQAGK